MQDKGMKNRTIALIAHDGKKTSILSWINYSNNREKLSQFKLVGTATTAKMINEGCGLTVDVLEPHEFASGPLGGDLILSVEILKGNIDAVIFFIDPMDVHPHQADIHALERACVNKNVPLALNRATADMIITSPLLV